MLKVEIYTTNRCAYCKKVKEFFTKENVAFVEYNIETDISRRDEMVRKSGQMSVPIVSINGKMSIGYDPFRLREMLKDAVK